MNVCIPRLVSFTTWHIVTSQLIYNEPIQFSMEKQAQDVFFMDPKDLFCPVSLLAGNLIDSC